MFKNVQIFESLRRKKLKPEKFVYVSSRDIFTIGTEAWNLLNKINESVYHSKLGSDRWVRFDFSISPLYLSGFILTSATNRDPLNWVFEGSNDTIDYEIVYTNQGEKLCETHPDKNGVPICKDFVSKQYSLSKSVIYTSYRIRNTGKSSDEDPYLILSQVDFIGHFTDFPILTFKKCNNSTIIQQTTIVFVIVLIIPSKN